MVAAPARLKQRVRLIQRRLVRLVDSALRLTGTVGVGASLQQLAHARYVALAHSGYKWQQRHPFLNFDNNARSTCAALSLLHRQSPYLHHPWHVRSGGFCLCTPQRRRPTGTFRQPISSSHYYAMPSDLAAPLLLCLRLIYSVRLYPGIYVHGCI
jgi:hypothetical protein